MAALSFIIETLSVFAGFAGFIWLAFAALLIKDVRRSEVIEGQDGRRMFAQPTLNMWPKIMKIMYLSGVLISILVCLPFVTSPGFTVVSYITMLACMGLGLIYLRHFTIKVQQTHDRKSLRHCIIALFISSGYLAAFLLILIINPIFF